MNNLLESKHQELLSVGFSLYGKPPKKSADPEKLILDLIPAFYEDRKLFRLLLTWLNVASELVHLERLKTLAENLLPGQRAILSAVALKLIPVDRRWKILIPKGKLIVADVSLPEGSADPYLIKKYGVDREFEKIGVKTATILPDAERKILALSGITSQNSWLKIRALMGPNFRADIAYMYLSETAKGPADAARILNCSRDTAYRNWRALESVNVKKMVRLSA